MIDLNRNWSLDEKTGSFWEHLEELRTTLAFSLSVVFVGFLICFSFSTYLLPLLYLPLSQLSNAPELILLGPLDAVTITAQLSFWVSFSLTSPIWGFKILSFLAPALHQEERIKVRPFLLLSLLALTLSGYFAWKVMLPLSNSLLVSFSTPLGVPMWSLSAYMDYTLTLLLGAMVAGELSLMLLLSVHYRWISAAMLCSARRYVIVALLVISALLTPPDIFTQFMMFIPLYGLYELAILYAKRRAP